MVSFQEVHVTVDTDTTISNSQMKMQILEMRVYNHSPSFSPHPTHPLRIRTHPTIFLSPNSEASRILWI